MGLLADDLRGHVRDAEAVIATLNRKLAEALAAGRPTAGLVAEIRAISESRNFILARLRRLHTAESVAGEPSKTGTAPPLGKSF
jgi:hypothetical protein